MIVTLGFDVEEFDFPIELGKEIDFDTQLAVSSEGLESLLLLLERLHIQATFYTTANFAKHRAETIRRIVSEGHEIASHDFYHSTHSTPDPVGSKRELEKIAGALVVGYRAPRLAETSAKTLLKAGYKYDSSLNPTMIPSRYNNLNKPRSVFYEDSLCIYPVSVSSPLRIPLFWLSLHVMPLCLYKRLAYTALNRDGHLNLYFHPWEFSNRLADPRFGIPRYISRCSGTRLLQKFEALLIDLRKRGCHFTATRNYLESHE